MATTSLPDFGGVSTPITGRFLAHNDCSIVERAFLAAAKTKPHLKSAEKTEPTAQSP